MDETYDGWVLRNVYFENGEPLMHSDPEIDGHCPSEPVGEIIEAHGLIAATIPEMPPVGTKLYASPYKLWVTLSDDDIKEIVGGWGDAPITGFTRRLFDEIDLMYRKRNYG